MLFWVGDVADRESESVREMCESLLAWGWGG